MKRPRRVTLRKDTKLNSNKKVARGRRELRKDTKTNPYKDDAKTRMSVRGQGKMTRREIDFCMEYLKDFNVTQAGLRAGYSLTTALNSSQFMSKPNILKFIQNEMEKRAKRFEADADKIASKGYSLANADPRELFPFGACRFCHGIDHQYQMTLNEHRHAQQHHHQVMMMIADHTKRVPMDEKGGAGYSAQRDPHPECPECHGVGIPRQLDLKKLSDAAVMLFDGFKYNKDGSIEVKTRSRDRAMENFQLLMGFVQTRRKIEEFDPARMSDDQLDAALQTALDKGMLPLTDLTLLNAPVTIDYGNATDAEEEAEAIAE